MKIIKATILVLMCSTFLFNCMPAEEKSEEQLEMELQSQRKNENQQVVEDLIALRDDITMKVEKVSDRMESTNGNTKDELKSIQKTLYAQLKRVEASLKNVNSATEENWKDIKVETKELVAQMKEEGENLSTKIDALLEQTAKG